MKFDLPELPPSWGRTRLDRVATVNARIGWKALTADEYVPDGFAFLSTPNIKGQQIDFQDVHFITQERYDESPELKLRVGDVLLVKDGNTLGITNVIASLPRPATVNGSIAVVRPTGVEPRYLRYTLDSDLVQGMISSVKSGMGVPHLFQADIRKFPLPAPEPAAQRAIADFLDTETARVDGLIAKKRRIKGLLNERRTALRDNAFRSAPGWPLKRLLAAPMAYGVLVPRFVEPDAGVPMIRTLNIGSRGEVRPEGVATIDPVQSVEFRRTVLAEGDLILSVVGSMGRSAIVDRESAGANLNRPLARIQPRGDLPARLLWHWTQSTLFLDQARLSTGGGTAQPTLNIGDLAEFDVGLPPDPASWPAILESLDQACERLDALEDAIAKQIDLLQEHRRALITAGVTGEFALLGAS